MALRVVSAQHRNLRRWQENLHHAQLLSRIGDPHHQFLVFFERLLQSVNLAEDHGARIVLHRRRRRLCGRIRSSRKKGLFGKLFGEIY